MIAAARPLSRLRAQIASSVVLGTYVLARKDTDGLRSSRM
jgi:hypothetical protein